MKTHETNIKTFEKQSTNLEKKKKTKNKNSNPEQIMKLH